MDPEAPGQDEFMLVTGHDSATRTLTVTRGQKGTTAVAHNIGSAIQISTGIRDEVIIGLFTFTTPLPTVMLQGLKDFGQKNADGTYNTTASSINGYLDNIWNNVNATGNTPIAIALADVWRYFKPGSSGSTGDDAYRDSGTNDDWQNVTKSWGFETLSDGKTHPKGSPCQFWCQNNYVVVVTDGQANGDTGLKSSTYGVFNNKIKRDTEPTPGEYCPLELRHRRLGRYGQPRRRFLLQLSRHGRPDLLSRRNLLDLQRRFRHARRRGLFHVPPGHVSHQKSGRRPAGHRSHPVRRGRLRPAQGLERRPAPVSTYTVGLTIQNDMLAETAANGHGLNFSASNYQDLGESYVSILESIDLREDPMMYTTYAAPKQSVVSGRYGYVAHFVPRDGKSMWEGHLRRFRLAETATSPPTSTCLTTATAAACRSTTAPAPAT